jgi:cell division septation protein DedD
MEQPETHDPVRDSRTIRKAAPRNPMRPILVGAGMVAILGGGIIALSRLERTAADPAALVSPGPMHVEGSEVLPPGLAGGTKPEAGDRGNGPVPVKFYEVLEKGDQAAQGGGDIAVRSTMPLPPPSDDADAGKPAAATPSKPVAQAGPAATPPMGADDAMEGTTSPAPSPKPAPAMAAASPTPSKPPAAAMSGDYTLQVGSFSRQKGAQDLVARLNDKGHAAYMAEVNLGNKGTWYRVRVGRYPTEHAAKWARLDLVREGLSPIVVHDPKGP